MKRSYNYTVSVLPGRMFVNGEQVADLLDLSDKSFAITDGMTREQAIERAFAAGHRAGREDRPKRRRRVRRFPEPHAGECYPIVLTDEARWLTLRGNRKEVLIDHNRRCVYIDSARSAG